jgi:hypothetical protein
MLLGWAQCARYERSRASAIPSVEFFEKYKGVSRQLAPGFEVCSEQGAEFPKRESSLFEIARKPLRLKILTVSLWGSRFCPDFLVLAQCFQDFTSTMGEGVGRLSAERVGLPTPQSLAATAWETTPDSDFETALGRPAEPTECE